MSKKGQERVDHYNSSFEIDFNTSVIYYRTYLIVMAIMPLLQIFMSNIVVKIIYN